MSEIRVDNILSADGNAAPTYSQGINVAAGKTFTNAGDFTTSGTATISGPVVFSAGAEITGVTTFKSDLNNVRITGVTTFADGAIVSGLTTFSSGVSGINVVGPATFTQGAVATGVVTFTGLSITAGTVAHTGGITVAGVSTYSSLLDVNNAADISGNLTVGGNISCAGTITYEDVTSVDSVGVVTAQTDLKVNRNVTIAGLSTFTGAIDSNGGANIAGGLVANSAKVSNLTNNRPVLAGAQGELTDSGNLTFDGSTLTVTGTVAATNLTAGGKAPATTGKAIAMAMIFG
jgi:hypothetical protein